MPITGYFRKSLGGRLTEAHVRVCMCVHVCVWRAVCPSHLSRCTRHSLNQIQAQRTHRSDRAWFQTALLVVCVTLLCPLHQPSTARSNLFFFGVIMTSYYIICWCHVTPTLTALPRWYFTPWQMIYKQLNSSALFAHRVKHSNLYDKVVQLGTTDSYSIVLCKGCSWSILKDLRMFGCQPTYQPTACPKCIHYKHLSKRKCCLKWSLVSLSASLFEQFKGSYLRLSFHLNESPDTKYKSGLRFGWYSYLSPLWRMFKVTLLSPPKSPLLLSISHSKSPSYLTLSFPPASSHHST